MLLQAATTELVCVSELMCVLYRGNCILMGVSQTHENPLCLSFEHKSFIKARLAELSQAQPRAQSVTNFKKKINVFIPFIS